MDYVRMDGVYVTFRRKYGAPTIRAHVDGKQRHKADAALRDVTVRVRSGEGLAVLGRRRSGKTTLIGVLSGVHRPGAGTVHVRGHPTGTVALGVGFSASLPVRDNIRTNAQLLGMTPDTVDQRWDEIVSFSRLKPAQLDYPLRELDGKVRQRVAYSVVIHAEPDVFLADGQVVVGDSAFREASLDRLDKLRDDGHALVLAAGSRSVVDRLCSRGIVLEKGRVVFDGPLKPAFRTLRELRKD